LPACDPVGVDGEEVGEAGHVTGTQGGGKVAFDQDAPGAPLEAGARCGTDVEDVGCDW